MKWMAWSTTSALFFIGIGLILLCMTIAEIKWPGVERRGFLPIATTRGDRVFIALLSSAFVHLGFLAFGQLSLFIALGISAIWFLVLLRWG